MARKMKNNVRPDEGKPQHDNRISATKSRNVSGIEVSGTGDPKDIAGGLVNEKADPSWLDGYSGAAKPSQVDWGAILLDFPWAPLPLRDRLKRWADPMSNAALGAADIVP